MSASSAEPSRSRLAASLERWTNAHPCTFFALLSAWYVVLIWSAARRPLWYDELFTFYIAQQSSIGRIMSALRTIDLNPPLNYFFTRWSIVLFGAKPWVTRLPAIVGFWLGSFAIFVLLRRRTSAFLAAVGVLLFWSTPYFSYATEARPYGLLLGFTAVLIAAWDAAERNRRFTIPLIAASATLLLLSHVFGVLSLGAVIVGELVREARRKKLDLPVLLALFLPLMATVMYRPLFHSAVAIAFPPEAAVTWGKLYYLYFSIFRWMWRPLLAIAIILVLARKNFRDTESTQSRGLSVALTLLFFVPLGLTLVFLRSHGAFYERYGMVAVLPIVIVVPLIIRRFAANESSLPMQSFVAVGVLLLLSTTLRTPIQNAAAGVMKPKAAAKLTGLLVTSSHGPFRPWFKNLPITADLLSERERAPQVALAHFRPDLPIVAASELTFFEMDQREPESTDHRLYYLYDRNAELQIAHRSITDGVLNAREFFPTRSNVESYESFVATHPQFLALGTYEHPGDWLFRKLQQDGYSLRIVGRIAGYADSDIYLVSR